MKEGQRHRRRTTGRSRSQDRMPAATAGRQDYDSNSLRNEYYVRTFAFILNGAPVQPQSTKATPSSASSTMAHSKTPPGQHGGGTVVMRTSTASQRSGPARTGRAQPISNDVCAANVKDSVSNEDYFKNGLYKFTDIALIISARCRAHSKTTGASLWRHSGNTKDPALHVRAALVRGEYSPSRSTSTPRT